MSDEKITLYYNEHRLDAIRINLVNTDRDLMQELYKALDNLYKQVVPNEERESIETFLEEEAKPFAVYHFHDADEDYHFTDKLHNTFYNAACCYRQMIKDGKNNLTLDSIASLYFGEHQQTDGQAFSVLCDEMPNDSRITALIEFDFENGTVGICDNSEKEWQLYKLDDVIAAINRTERKSDISLEARREIFEEALVGKEMDLWAESDSEEETDVPTIQM